NAASASLALALAMIAVPATRSALKPLYWGIRLAVAASLVLTCGLLEVNYILRWINPKASQPKASGPEFGSQVVGSVAVWAVAVALIKLWYGLCIDNGGDYGLFFAYRAVHLATLVSPLAPMLPLLAAIYLWAIGSIWRLRFNKEARPRLDPKLDDGSYASKSGQPKRDDGSNGSQSGQPQQKSTDRELRPGFDSEKPIADAICEFALSPLYRWCFVLILAVWFSLNRGHPFELFERIEFGKFYVTLFFFVVASILTAGLRTAQIWWRLRQLLIELNRSLVRFTFDRVKEPSWSPIWHQGTEETDWHYTVWSVEVIDRIEHKKGGATPSLDKCAPKAGYTLGDIRDMKNRLTKTRAFVPFHTSLEYLDRAPEGKRVAGQFRVLQRRIQDLQKCLATILVKALDILQDSWKKNPPDPKDGGEGKENDKHSVVNTVPERQALLEKYVALRYLAFIRAVLDHIRRLLIFLAIAFSLLLISLNVYS